MPFVTRDGQAGSEQVRQVPFGRSHTLSGSGAIAATAAFLLPVAYSPSAGAPFWSPKVAVLLVTAAAGLTRLAALRRTDARAPVLAAVTFLAVAATATVVSPTPLAALLGSYRWGTGLVFLLACVGLWALGSTLPATDRELVSAALLLGIAVSAAVGVAQAMNIVGIASLRASGRVYGLSGNPVHVASLVAAACAYAAHEAKRDARWVLAVAVGGFLIQLTGTRFALIVAVAAAVVGAIRCSRARGVLLIVALTIGIAAGSLVAGAQELAAATARAGSSTLASGAGSTVRIEVWKYARHAVFRRPALGSGPATFRAATSRDVTEPVARAETSDVVYADAHNILVEHTVTTGVLGVTALMIWLFLIFRKARGPLAWFGGAMLLMGLVQPMNVGTTPLMFLALGLAAPVMIDEPPRKVVASLMAVAAITGLVVLIGDVKLHQAFIQHDQAAAETANLLLRPWPEPATVLAVLEDRRADRKGALRWRTEALRRDPTDPKLARLLASEELAAGKLAAARVHARLALRNNPWSEQAKEILSLASGGDPLRETP